MKIWKIWGNNLPELYVDADSLDEALSIARKRNPFYNTAQIHSGDRVKAVYRVLGKNGHRQRASFGNTFRFTTFEDVNIICKCADVTSTNEYVDVIVVADDFNKCAKAMEKQLSVGIFENCEYGKVILRDIAVISDGEIIK